MYDVVIIGGGVIGCSVARELAKYQLKVAVLEKENDVCEVTSMANSAIVHSGYDPKPGTLKAKLNRAGNLMFDQISKELDVEFKRIGSLTVASSEKEMEVLKQLVERAKQNAVRVELWDSKKVHASEPNLQDNICGALYAPDCGIVNPFELTVAMMENAMDNGVELYLNHQVTDIKKMDEGYQIITNAGNFTSKVIVNAAGLQSGDIARIVGNTDIEITPRKGEYFVLDHFEKVYVNHTIFPLPSEKGKGILVTPTTHGNYLIGPNNNEAFSQDLATTAIGLKEVKANITKMMKDVPFNQTIRSFAGLRARDIHGDFIIKEDELNKGFIQVAGIQSPGLASSPAIAKYVVSLIANCIDLKDNPHFNPYRRPLIKLARMSTKEIAALIDKDHCFGKVVCRCEKISEGEICDIIHRNCGATTIRGIKKRIRPGFGKCQGGFCEPLCVQILARELKIDPGKIKYGSSCSYLFSGKSKEEK